MIERTNRTSTINGYLGSRMLGGTNRVWDPAGQQLDPRVDLWNHSPTGLEWGYGGSGPAQLALGILADYLTRNYGSEVADRIAVDLHQRFKFTVISKLHPDEWEIPLEYIRGWLDCLEPSLCERVASARVDIALEQWLGFIER